MLFEVYEETFVLRELTRVPNGMGGLTEEYVDGAEFKGALVMDNSTQARIAEKQGVTSLYTLTVSPDVPLKYGDLFKSVETGDVYRITSRTGEKKTPSVASFQFQNFSAELYTL